MLIQNNTSNAVQTPLPVIAAGNGGTPASTPDIQPAAATAAIQTASTQATSQDSAVQTAAPSKAQLQNAVTSTNQSMLAKGLAFSVDSTTKQTVVKLMDTSTGVVIGQFPSQQMIDISKAIALMQEQLQQASMSKASVPTTQGLLIKQQA